MTGVTDSDSLQKSKVVSEPRRKPLGKRGPKGLRVGDQKKEEESRQGGLRVYYNGGRWILVDASASQGGRVRRVKERSARPLRQVRHRSR